FELHCIAEHGDFGAVLAGKTRVPCLFNFSGSRGIDTPGRDQDAARPRSVCEQVRRVLLDLETLSCGETAGEDRRQTDKWVEQAVEAVVDDLASWNYNR